MKVLATGLNFPEGPVAMPDGSILVSEISSGTIRRVWGDGRTEVIATTGGGPNGAALGPEGRLYVCNNGGTKHMRRDGWYRPIGIADDYGGGRIEVVDLKTGKVERLYERCGEHPLKGPNDIVFDGTGGFWFTDTGKHYDRYHDHGGVYWAKADGTEIREVIYPLNRPNGIGLSPDSKTLYVAETPQARLWAWEVSGPGKVRKLPWPSNIGGRLAGGMAGVERFDSLKVTASGRVCVATITGGGIAEIFPDTATVRHHPMPDMHVTNLCFGGADMRTAWITFSQSGWLVEMRWHEAGLKLHFN